MLKEDLHCANCLRAVPNKNFFMMENVFGVIQNIILLNTQKEKRKD